MLGLARTLRRPGGQAVAHTAGFNVAVLAASGIGGVVLARAVGPTVRGEYAAITAWFGVALMVGGMGQPAALCFYVAREPQQGPAYVATSRAIMLVTGVVALVAGILLAPLLAHGNASVATGYRIAFGASIVAFVGASYTFSLQARDLLRWNRVRLVQPCVSLIAIVILWRLRYLSLDTALAVLAGTMVLQLCWAYRSCHFIGLAPGRAQTRLVGPLATYGLAQIAALTPTTLNAQLDQLVLSQTVSSADLGRYAVAVTLSSLPVPLVSAIGSVAFPRLAAQRIVSDETHRLLRLAVLGSAILAATMLIPLALIAYWLVPLVFGAAYRGAVPLLWILTPGSVFLACGQVTGDLLRGRNRPILVAWAQGLAAVFTVALLLVLLPIMGVSGAAVASTIAYGVALAVMLRSLGRRPRHVKARSSRSLPSPNDLAREDLGGSMSVLRRIGANATDLACRVVGRRNVVRGARFILYRARLDVPNDIHTNGEAYLQRWILDLSLPGQQIHVFDVGANVGQWSTAMLGAARIGGRLEDLDLHAFEASRYTFDRLTERLNGYSVLLRHLAIHDRIGQGALHVLARGAGINSLHKPAGTADDVMTEDVETITLDSYIDRCNFDRIELIKIDTEGNDLAVLRGARSLFAKHQISVVQFEYNHRWVSARYFLRDVFELLEPLGYRIGKLTPYGIEIYPGWDPDLETFVEGNYVACTEDIVNRLPSVEWWKSGPKALRAKGKRVK